MKIRNGYLPQEHGADCEHCPLQGAPLVPPEINPGASVLLVGDAPNRDEAELGHPFVGASGQEVMKALAGYARRDDLSWSNAILCQAPGNNLKRLEYDTRKRIKAGAKLRQAVDCCAPRLKEEIKPFKHFIVMGNVAARSVLDTGANIMDLRGAPIEADDGKKYLPTVHPSFVLRARRWTHIFRNDIAKAFRLFTEGLDWQTPDLIFNPSPTELGAWIQKHAIARGLPIAYDVETDALEPLIAKVRCIGLSAVEQDGKCRSGVVVALRNIKDGACPYPAGDEAQIRDLLKRFLAAPHILKVGHNAGYYDSLVCEHEFGVIPAPLSDTILLHRAVESELPHSLGFLGSVYTDARAWKADRNALDYESDLELAQYNVTDTVITARVYPGLMLSTKLRDQDRVVAVDHRIQRVCRDMHKVGMFVDLERVHHHAEDFLVQINTLLGELRELTGRPKFNPGSYPQVGDLLFNEWGIPINPKWTNEITGSISTDKETILDILRMPTLNEQQKIFLEKLHKYRRAVKWYGTFVREIPEQIKEVGDNRLHGHFNCHATVSGRISVSTPGLHQFPKKMRDMIVPAPGHVFVGADMDQIELRFNSALAGATGYLNVFNSGGDPHALTASMIYGETFTKLEPKSEGWSKLRDFSKRFSYACLYGAEDDTVHRVIIETEGRDGGFPYLGTNPRETARLRRAWLNANAEFERFWQETLEAYRRQGYVAEIVLGRRRDFLDGEDRNEIVNFPAQAGSNAIVNLATLELIDAGITAGYAGPGTGLIYQGHDALMIECPEADGERVAALLQQCMTRRVDGLDVLFSASAKIGRSWKEV